MIKKLTETKWTGVVLAIIGILLMVFGIYRGEMSVVFTKAINICIEWPRHGIQALWALLTNSHLSGFVTGKIYTGKLKNVCVPGLNCYSCPGAVGACPIGSLQAVVGSWNFKMAYYVVGFLIFIGAIFGRLICGFLCPFGLIQDL